MCSTAIQRCGFLSSPVLVASSMLTFCLLASRTCADELSFMTESHRASRESIRTCYCTLEFSVTMTNTQTKSGFMQGCTSECWYSPEACRVKAKEVDAKTDYIWKDSIKNTIITREKDGVSQVGSSRTSYSSRYIHRGDAYIRGLLALNVPGTSEHVVFEELLKKASKVISCQSSPVDGRQMMVVKLLFQNVGNKGDWNMEIFFDPLVNSLIRRVIYISPTGTRRESEVIEFKDFGNGVYFPIRITGTARYQDGSSSKSTTSISDVRINQNQPAGIFTLSYQQGTVMTDGNSGTAYRIDASGNRISTQIPLSKATPAGNADSTESVPGSATLTEPRTWTMWIAPVSILVLLLAGVLYFVQRRRDVQT